MMVTFNVEGIVIMILMLMCQSYHIKIRLVGRNCLLLSLIKEAYGVKVEGNVTSSDMILFYRILWL